MRTTMLVATFLSLLTSHASATRVQTIETEVENPVLDGTCRPSPTRPGDQDLILETPRQGHQTKK